MHECENRAVIWWAFAVRGESAADGRGASAKSDARSDVAAKFTDNVRTKSDSKQLSEVTDLVQLSDFLRSYSCPRSVKVSVVSEWREASFQIKAKAPLEGAGSGISEDRRGNAFTKKFE